MSQSRFSNGLYFDDLDLDLWISGHIFMPYFHALNYCSMLNINGYAVRFWKPITSVWVILFLVYSEILLNFPSPDQISSLGSFSNPFPCPPSTYN